MVPLKKSGFNRAIVVGVLATTTLAGCGTRQPAHSERVAAAHKSSVVSLGANGSGQERTFMPAPAGAKPKLSAQQAWARYTKVDTTYTTAAIPRNVSVHLGVLTIPIGPTGPNGTEAYLVHNKLVYGYSWHSCPPSTSGATLPPNPCIEWNFLNANTGHQIVETFQMTR